MPNEIRSLIARLYPGAVVWFDEGLDGSWQILVDLGPRADDILRAEESHGGAA